MQFLSFYKFIHAISESNFWIPLCEWNMQSERTFLTICVWLIFTWFTKNSTSCLKSKYLKQRSLVLMLNNILLNRLLIIEARFYHMIQEANDELLGILLLPMPIQWHNSFHKRRNEIKRSLLRAIWLSYKLNVCAEQALPLFFFSIAKLLVTLIRNAKFMQRNSMKKTLHYRIKKTSVSCIIHSKCHFFIL